MKKKLAAAALAWAAFAAGSVFAQVPHNGVDRHHGDSQFPIEVLSSRPDAISGGDALIRVTVKRNVPASAVRVKLNGADVTSSFVVSANMLTGVVSGMRVGENLLEVIDPRPLVWEVAALRVEQRANQLAAETIAAAHHLGAVVRVSDGNARGHVRDQAASADVDFAAWNLGEGPTGLTPVR